ncbi:MAG: hypothetical protein WBY53_06310 [Acidobacteriaceae bacterium]
MNLRIAFVSLALASFAATALASNANNFTLVNSKSGKSVGKASYSIDKSKNVFKVQGRFEYHIPSSDLPSSPQSNTTVVNGRAITNSNEGFVDDGQYTTSYKVNADGDFLSGFVQNETTLTMTSFEPNKAHTAVTVTSVQAGKIGDGEDLPIPKPNFLFAADGDPSAIQILITEVLTHPHPDATYLVVVPPGISNHQPDLFYVTVQPIKDQPTGTLDGKPIALKRFIMNFHVGHADIYVDNDGNLMQANMTPMALKYIRAKFTLNP